MSTVAQRLLSDRFDWPGMLPGEIVVWRAWMRVHLKEYDRFEANVRLGKGEDPGPTFPQKDRDMWIANTQLRADAIGWQGTTPTIFEVKDDAQPGAPGQIAAYRTEWMAEGRSAERPKAVIVCRTFSPNIVRTCAEQDISIAQVSVTPDEMRIALGLQRFGGRTK